MSDFYTQIRDNTAAPLIRQFGKSITLVRKPDRDDLDCEYDATTGTEICTDPDTGEVVDPGEDQEFEGHAVEDRYSASLIDGSAIRVGDRRLLCVDIPRPKQGSDKLKIGDRAYSIVNVSPLAPGEVEILYEVQAR